MIILINLPIFVWGVINMGQLPLPDKQNLTDEEFFAELDKNISTKTRKLIKKYAQKTTSELLDDHVRSPEVREELRDKYDL